MPVSRSAVASCSLAEPPTQVIASVCLQLIGWTAPPGRARCSNNMGAHCLITLTVLSGPAAGASVTREANSKRLYLGRIKTGNAIPLNDPSVSSKHLEVLFRDGSWFVEDLDSTNGTRLNDGEGKLLTGMQWQWCLGPLQRRAKHNPASGLSSVAC
jgi:hypothetical protein